jgi:hypothetical protein
MYDTHRRVAEALHNLPQLFHKVPNDVHPGVLLRDGLLAHGAHGPNVDLFRLHHLLALSLLDQLGVGEELVQLGVDQSNVAGHVLRFLAPENR